MTQPPNKAVSAHHLGVDLDQTLRFIQQLNGGMDRIASYSDLQVQLETMLRSTMIYYFDIGGFSCVRGRIASAADVETGVRPGGKLRRTAALSYTPTDKTTSFGRCHRPGDPVFYASRITQTIFSELDVNAGDYVVLGRWEMPTNRRARTCFLGIVDQYRKTKIAPIPVSSDKEYKTLRSNLEDEIARRFETDQGLISLLVDAFFADIFSRKASAYHEYKLTSIVSSYLFSDRKFDVIAYPSVKHYGSINYAIQRGFLDSNFALKEAKIVRINQMLGYGLYNAETVAETEVTDGAQEIQWPEIGLSEE